MSINKNYIKPGLVSIIVPVFNAEKYIKKCIDSLLKQTYKNIEIIIINDGSTDKSSDILKKIQDRRIVMISKNNEGVSNARNIGLQKSKGEFIMFVDADDYVDNDYVEYFLGLINHNNKKYDIAASFNKYSIFSPTQVKSKQVIALPTRKITEYIYTGKINVAVWNKIYRKRILTEKNIIFDENVWYGEGMLFNIQYLHFTTMAIVGNKRVYHQVYNQKSAMRDFNIKSNLNGLKSLDMQKKYLDNKDKTITNSWEFHRFCFNMSILKGIMKTRITNSYHNEYKKCISNLHKGWFYPLIVDIPTKKRVFYLFSSIFPRTASRLFIIFENHKVKKL